MEYGRDPGSKGPERWTITCAGMPETCHKDVTFDNFRTGSRYNGKLVPQHVPGGIILRDTQFTIEKNIQAKEFFEQKQIRLEE